MVEGDPITGGVSITWLIAIGGTVVGGVFGLLKWFASRMLAEIEDRIKRIDDVEERFERMLAELPLHYQRRDDAIREYTAINAKLDRLYELMMRDRQ